MMSPKCTFGAVESGVFGFHSNQRLPLSDIWCLVTGMPDVLQEGLV